MREEQLRKLAKNPHYKMTPQDQQELQRFTSDQPVKHATRLPKHRTKIDKHPPEAVREDQDATR